MDSIKNALFAVIDEYFGCEVYQDLEEIAELERPFFFMQIAEASGRRTGTRRHERDVEFRIDFYPEAGNAASDILEVGDTLYMLLEQLEDPETGEMLCRGSQMRFEVKDQILQFYVNYKYHLIEPNDGVLMEQLKTKEELKYGS